MHTYTVSVTSLTGSSGSYAASPSQQTTAAELRQLLLQTVSSEKSYPFALLPLLQDYHHDCQATLWPISCLPRRHYQVKPPCFAARPLYAKHHPRPLLTFPMRVPRIRAAKLGDALTSNTPSNPMYKYATMGRVQTIQSVPVSTLSKGALTGLHTYAGLGRAVACNGQVACTPQQAQQALQQFARLDKRTGHRTDTAVRGKAAGGWHTLRSYARMGKCS